MYICKRGYADGPFGQVHYRDTGNGVPLVLCHQAPMSSRQFDSVYGFLAEKGVRAIGIDAPGFGLSDPTDFVPTVEDFAKVVPPVLDHLGITAACVLGHHTGALVATEVAVQFPDRVTTLILNGPLPQTDEERKRGLNAVETKEKTYRPQPDGQHFVTLFRNRMKYATKDTDLSLATRYIVEQLSGMAPFWYGHHAAFTYGQAAVLPKIKHRTLVLTNTGDSIYELAKRTVKLRPDFEYAEIEGGSIDVVDERSEQWAKAVAAFVLS